MGLSHLLSSRARTRNAFSHPRGSRMRTTARRLSAFLHQLKALTFNDIAMVSYTIASSTPTRTRHVHASAHVTRTPIYAPEVNFLNVSMLTPFSESNTAAAETHARTQCIDRPAPHIRPCVHVTPASTHIHARHAHITPTPTHHARASANAHTRHPQVHTHVTHTHVGSSSYRLSTDTNRSSTD